MQGDGTLEIVLSLTRVHMKLRAASRAVISPSNRLVLLQPPTQRYRITIGTHLLRASELAAARLRGTQLVMFLEQELLSASPER